MTVKSIQSLVNSAMQEIKTIKVNEAYEIFEEIQALCFCWKQRRELDISTPRYEHRQWQHPQMGMSVTHWIDPNDNW